MKIFVKIIGPLMYEAGFSERILEIPVASTAGVLLSEISIPKERAKIVTRNGKAIAPEEFLEDGDRIAISPIYSGG
jgi:molybdopterin converting factor small subunit